MSFLDILRGGRKRKIFCLIQLIKKPFFMQSTTIWLPGLSNSIAKIIPLPRTSLTIECWLAKFSRHSRKYFHVSEAFFKNPFSVITFKDARAASQVSGLPPKVDAWVPGTNDFIIRLVAAIAPIAIPPPNALARVIMSGLVLNIYLLIISKLQKKRSVKKQVQYWLNLFKGKAV